MQAQTMAELRARFPDAEIGENPLGELVVYTGLRINWADEHGPLIPHECPTCHADEPHQAADCGNLWHRSASRFA